MILNIAGYGWRGRNVCFLDPPSRDCRLRCTYRLLEMVFLDECFVSDESGELFVVDIT